MSSTTLNEFVNFISQVDDDEMLEVAEGLMLDIVEIERKKEEIERLEEGLSAGKRAAFWMEAMNLDREEIDLATNKITGRRRVLKDKEARANLGKEKPEQSHEAVAAISVNDILADLGVSADSSVTNTTKV